MQLPEICIRRPVFATVMSLLVLLVGYVSFTRLAVREYPKIDEPVVTVETRFAGASSEVVEGQVTKVLEDSLAGIEGVDVITSISRQEQSQITVRFRLERDADGAAADVRDKVSRVRQRLPQGIDEPVVAKVEADAFPVIWLALSSDTHTALELSDFANRLVKPVLQTAPGAADVRIFGERKYAMRVWLDPDRLAAYKLTTEVTIPGVKKLRDTLAAKSETCSQPGPMGFPSWHGSAFQSMARMGERYTVAPSTESTTAGAPGSRTKSPEVRAVQVSPSTSASPDV